VINPLIGSELIPKIFQLDQINGLVFGVERIIEIKTRKRSSNEK
tara:strand:- start:289 stop:420 length:132 start_codon:yes stop_codon:yes gene_type:complete